MAQFIVPLFLACVLLVVSQPLHAWTRKRITTHQRWVLWSRPYSFFS